MFQLRTGLARLLDLLTPRRPVRASRTRPRFTTNSVAGEFLESRQLLAAVIVDPTFGGASRGETAFDLRSLPFNLSNPVTARDDQAAAVAVQANGDVVVVGTAERTVSGQRDFAVTRLDASGNPDQSFGRIGLLLPGRNGLRTVPTPGRVTIAFDLMRAFGIDPDGDDNATSVAIQPDGKILIAGSAQADLAGRRVFAIARLTSAGALDTTFSDDGLQTVEFSTGTVRHSASSTGMVLQADGRIVMAGSVTLSSGDTDMAVVRLLSDGALDTSFDRDGRATVAFNIGPAGSRADAANAVALQADGRIILAGSAQRSAADHDFAVARLNPGGSLDGTFDVDGRQTVAFNLGGTGRDVAHAVTVSGGKIILAGEASDATGTTDFAIARLHSHGRADVSFLGTGRGTVEFAAGGNDIARAVAVQADGRIVLAGVSRSARGDDDAAIVRLNASGTLDRSFDFDGRWVSNATVDDAAHALLAQPDGALLTAGFKRGVNGDQNFQTTRVRLR